MSYLRIFFSNSELGSIYYGRVMRLLALLTFFGTAALTVRMVMWGDWNTLDLLALAMFGAFLMERHARHSWKEVDYQPIWLNIF